jgi:hypothetical protein
MGRAWLQSRFDDMPQVGSIAILGTPSGATPYARERDGLGGRRKRIRISYYEARPAEEGVETFGDSAANCVLLSG